MTSRKERGGVGIFVTKAKCMDERGRAGLKNLHDVIYAQFETQLGSKRADP